MSSGREPRSLQDYWEIIRVDGARFLTLHPAYESRLYHDRIKPSAGQDFARGLRGTLVGTVRLLRGLLRPRPRQGQRPSFPPEAFVLLVTVGGPKYAREEREMAEACQRKGLGVRKVYATQSADNSPVVDGLSIESCLTPGDYARVLVDWLGAVSRGLRWCLSGDGKRRSLFVASIPALRQYHTHIALARRIVSDYGLPTFAVSLAPWTATSIAVVDHMRQCGVLTAGIRTQTTYAEPEHLVIDTDLLFCKSSMEGCAYEDVFAGKGPRLEEGCLLSLPETYQLEALSLPQEYVLVLGTDPPDSQGAEDRKRFHDRLRQAATAAGLPVVYKEHHAPPVTGGRGQKDARVDSEDWLHVSDVRRNRELIDHASLVVSAPSTLLYYAILRETPVVIVEAYPFEALPDEFATAPIKRISWHDEFHAPKLDRTDLSASSASAKAWFETNYFLDKGPDFMVSVLVGEAPGSTPAQPQTPKVSDWSARG